MDTFARCSKPQTLKLAEQSLFLRSFFKKKQRKIFSSKTALSHFLAAALGCRSTLDFCPIRKKCSADFFKISNFWKKSCLEKSNVLRQRRSISDHFWSEKMKNKNWKNVFFQCTPRAKPPQKCSTFGKKFSIFSRAKNILANPEVFWIFHVRTKLRVSTTQFHLQFYCWHFTFSSKPGNFRLVPAL